MRCTYSYPSRHAVQKTFWFIHWNSLQEPEDLSQDPEYSHRVEYLGNQNNDCTFRINQLKESDSAIYCFRFLTNIQDGKYFGQPGVSLTVTGLQVKVTENEAQSVTLTCSSTCTLRGRRTFTWYKNGIAVPYENEYSLNLASTDDTDLYSCATGRVTSPEVNVKCVKVEIISDTVSGGETVELTCRATCTRLGNSFIWYKNEQLLTDDYKFSQSHRILTFTARSKDTGRYSCAVRGNQRLVSPAVTLSVRCVKIEITFKKVSEGEWVTLTCKITCTHLTGSQTFSWYKNGQFLQNNARKYQQDDYLQFKASSGDAGSYSCALRGHENLPSPAVTLYTPKNASVAVSPSGEIVEGSSVTLTCSSDANPPVQRCTWYKNNRALPSQTISGQKYTIKEVNSRHAGEYYCGAENAIGTDRSPHINLKVQCLKVDINSITVTGGETVELTCRATCTHLSNNFIWYKNEKFLPDYYRFSQSYRNLTFTARSEDTGRYSCAVRGNQNLVSPAVTLSVR
ncbi:B-cell receptor CD22-like [Anguilla anguilla]|uniref:B-cell receptor CD22-like n=1 Tax=Anguilla anguilla TaxID=7936 RepID=UPI0015A989FA|nr:B-cell receptor CD22-like [Anguilla anguilla]